MKPLTPHQLRVHKFIQEYTRQHGHPPSYQALGAMYGTTKQNVAKTVYALERKGAIRREPRVPYSLEALDIDLAS